MIGASVGIGFPQPPGMYGYRHGWRLRDNPDIRMWCPIEALGFNDGDQVTTLTNFARPAPGSTVPVATIAKGGGTGATSGPTYKAAPAGFNGRAMLYWPASNAADLEAPAGNGNLFTAIPLPVTYWWVLKCEDRTANRVILENHTGTNRHSVSYLSTGNIQWYAGTARSVAVDLTTAAALLSIEFNGASSKMFVNKVQVDAGNVGSNTVRSWVFGKDQDGVTSNWRGWMLPPLIMAGIPSTYDRATIDNWFGKTYGLF